MTLYNRIRIKADFDDDSYQNWLEYIDSLNYEYITAEDNTMFFLNDNFDKIKTQLVSFNIDFEIL